MTQHEQTQAQIIAALADIKHIGPARAELLYTQLHIRDARDVVAAAEAGTLRTLSGIGAKTEQAILRAARPLARQLDEAETQQRLAIDDAPAALEAEPTPEAESTPEAEPTPAVEVKAEPTPEAHVKPVRRAPAPTADLERAPSHPRSSIDRDRAPARPAAPRAALFATPEAPRTPRAPEARLLSSLLCPNCGNDAFTRGDAKVTCDACQRAYSATDGVIDLTPLSHHTSLGQRLLDTRLYARLYEGTIRPKLTRTLASSAPDAVEARALELLALQPTSRVLDVACGTGHLVRTLAHTLDALTGDAPTAYLLVGMDLSQPMLHEAAELTRRENLHKRAFFVRGNALRLPMRSATFDRVRCGVALNLIDDPDEALRNMARVLEPGGTLVLSAFIKSDAPLRRNLARLASPTGLHLFELEDLRSRLTRAGFELDVETRQGDTVTLRCARWC